MANETAKLPLDELTIHLIRLCLDSFLRWNEETGKMERIGSDGIAGAVSLEEFLWFLSGEAVEEEVEPGLTVVTNGGRWSEHDLIRELLDEIERLRSLVHEDT